MAILFIPITFILAFSKESLQFIGIEAETSNYASTYVYWNIAGNFFLSQFDCLKSYLNVMKHSDIILKSTLAAGVVHPFIAYYLIY